jgi:2-polyprenyl-3-methyl-5-hydroxy-6-metoxy-1,4-benzoquinol methylase
MTSRDEREALERFRERYATTANDAAAAIEQQVLGAAWGANGYTTVDQADELARRLALRPDHLLLDVGTGRGWPGLYLAARTGCRLVGADMPLDGLRAAMVQAGHQRLRPQVAMVAASAANLPFRRQAFDAIVHTDVLC